MVWMGPSKLRWVQLPTPRISPALEAGHDLVEQADGLIAGLPFGGAAQQVLFGDHFEDRSHVLGHAAVDQHQALLEFLARFGGDLVRPEDLVIGQQAAAADAEFGIALPGRHAVNQLDAGPDAAGVLPAAAGAAQPFAQDGARGKQAAVLLLQPAGKGVNLAGGTHAGRNQAGQQGGGDGEARALGNIVDLADQLDPVAAFSGKTGQQIAQRFGADLHAGRHQAGGDDRGFEQTQVVAREIEYLGERGDIGSGREIHAGKAQHGRVDYAKVGFHWRNRLAGEGEVRQRC